MEKGKIYFIMGIAWAGKWTLIKNLQESGVDFKFPLSCKTRPKRDFEVDWVDARFLTEENFKSRIDNNEFLEYAFVHEWGYYGTLMEEVYDSWIMAWKTVIKELDYHGLVKLQKERPEFKENYTTIFLNIPNEEIKARVIARWEDMTELDYKNRIASTEKERGDLSIYDYVIDSHKNNAEEVLKIVLDIIKKG